MVVTLTSLAGGPGGPQDPRPIDYPSTIEPLFAKFCFRCHGDDKQKGDVQLNLLDHQMLARADAEGWHAALDMIQSGEMPPEDEDQMSDAQRRLMVRWLRESLQAAADRQKGERRVVMRRLTREQYTNSLQDLLGVSINFARTLPEDGKAQNGFSNNGEVLQASPLHLDNYQLIARQGLQQAIAKARPPVTHYRVTFGKGIGKGKVAGKTGGYQSVPLNPGDFTVEILADGRVVTGGSKAQQQQRERIQRKISVGLRGSGAALFDCTACPEGGVELVGEAGHVLVPEGAATSRWRFADGVLTASPGWDSLVTPEAYQDFRMHVEFNVNDVQGADHERNGNSGVYIQQRYEIQILNSHGIAPEAYQTSDCGSLYRLRKPDQLVARPAGEWQAYDILFRAARFDGDRKVEDARLTVVHNGVVIHDAVSVPRKTGAGRPEGADPRPIKLQGHANEVRFRNVWIEPLALDEFPLREDG